MNDLTSYIKAETAERARPEATAFADDFAQNPAVQAVLFYGSALWKKDAQDIVYDFYVLIDSYKSYGSQTLTALGGTLIPPNVYYKQISHNGQTIRCKYAVLTVDQFLKAAAGRSFTPHIWARFAQPCRILFTRSDRIKSNIIRGITDALRVFHERSLRLCGKPEINPRLLWAQGLRMTYSCELRSESPQRTDMIFEAHAERFSAVTAMICDIPNVAHNQYFQNPYYAPSNKRERLYFQIKRPFMKLVIICRFIKAAFTFSGGMEYAQWKIKKHSGLDIEMTEFQKKHPLIGGWPVFWRVMRAGGLK